MCGVLDPLGPPCLITDVKRHTIMRFHAVKSLCGASCKNRAFLARFSVWEVNRRGAKNAENKAGFRISALFASLRFARSLGLFAALLRCALGTVLLLSLHSSGGAEVHASFLQDSNSLLDTLRFLGKNGCTPQGIAVFQDSVREYFKEPFGFDLARFPKPTNGFYRFASPDDLIAALPQPLVETNHSFDFNCMDAVIAIAHRRLRTTLHPDDLVGPFLVTIWLTNHTAVGFPATPRDAFNVGSSSSYREVTNPLFPERMRDARMCLSPFLLRWYVLPRTAGEDTLEAEVLEVLRTTWQREALKFPSRFEVVLLHSVDLSEHTICTCHAALLFHRKNGYTYIEKAGRWGPFIRLDLADRLDLMPWLALAFKDFPYASSHRFVTFGGRTIRRIGL